LRLCGFAAFPDRPSKAEKTRKPPKRQAAKTTLHRVVPADR
jgi:hypothetical protein